MVRYGILGFGLHGWKRLVPAFAGAKNSKLTGIWRRNLDKAKANANDYGIETVFAYRRGIMRLARGGRCVRHLARCPAHAR